jgi:hypothetical protein
MVLWKIMRMPIKGIYQTNPEYYRQKAREYDRRNREKIRARVNAYRSRPEIREHLKECEREMKQNWKFSVLTVYSNGQPKCACCGETEIAFLTIDHINGGGRRHVAKKGVGGGIGLYRWLIRNNFPDGFQVLCMNCNFARRRGRLCPHEEKRLLNPKAKLDEEN